MYQSGGMDPGGIGWLMLAAYIHISHVYHLPAVHGTVYVCAKLCRLEENMTANKAGEKNRRWKIPGLFKAILHLVASY